MSERIVVVGSANMDVVIPVARLPRAGETLAGGDMALFPGGKGANQACAAGKLGGTVSFVGQVGDDPFGTELLASLTQSRVDVSAAGISERPTGCASIYVLGDGENSIVISPGANATLDPAAAITRLEMLGGAGIVLLQLEIPLETVAAALGWAKSQGARTILDPAPARPLPPALLRQVDILTPNRSEAAALVGRPSWDIRTAAEALEAAGALLALGPSAVILKLGAEGCLAAAGDTRQRIDGIRVNTVDTTAAGDAFNGALAVALSQGKTLVEAAVFANAAGAIAATRPGAQSSLPSREDLGCLLATAAGV